MGCWVHDKFHPSFTKREASSWQSSVGLLQGCSGARAEIPKLMALQTGLCLHITRSSSVAYSTRQGAGIACWLERRTRDPKVVSSNPGMSVGRIFFSRVNFVCLLLFGVRSTPVLPQCHVKDMGYSGKSAGGRLHLDTHAPLTQQSRSGLTMPLSRPVSYTHLTLPTRRTV